MYAFRIFLLMAVILVATSDGLFIKKGLLKNKVAVKAGLLADTKAAALKFKAGAALKKDAVLGGFKALGKAKLGLIGGIKAAKLKVLGGLAAVKLAKVAAVKAGKLAFLKTLAAAKLAPFAAKAIAAKAVVGGGAAALGGAGDFLKDSFGAKEKPDKSLLESVVGGILGGGVPLPFGDGAGNPLGSILGDLVLGGLTGGLGGGSDGGKSSIPKPDFGSLLSTVGSLGGLGGLSSLIPEPGKPTVNIQTYQVNPAPASAPSYGPPPAPVTSYGTPVGSPSPTYSQPATTYGVPQY